MLSIQIRIVDDDMSYVPHHRLLAFVSNSFSGLPCYRKLFAPERSCTNAAFRIFEASMLTHSYSSAIICYRIQEIQKQMRTLNP